MDASTSNPVHTFGRNEFGVRSREVQKGSRKVFSMEAIAGQGELRGETASKYGRLLHWGRKGSD